jgi:hypothetical protein
MTQYLQLPAQCNVQPYWPDLAHLIAGTPAWQRDRDRAIALAGRPRIDEIGLAGEGVGLRVVAALVAVPLASALLGSVVLLFGTAGA